MNSLLNRMARLVHTAVASRRSGVAQGVARNLMERAEAGAGRDPHQAQELRCAAYAYLSVVR